MTNFLLITGLIFLLNSAQIFLYDISDPFCQFKWLEANIVGGFLFLGLSLLFALTY